MNRIETKILNCFAVKEAEKNMVFAARLTQRGHIIHSMNDLMYLYNQSFTNEILTAAYHDLLLLGNTRQSLLGH